MSSSKSISMDNGELIVPNNPDIKSVEIIININTKVIPSIFVWTK